MRAHCKTIRMTADQPPRNKVLVFPWTKLHSYTGIFQQQYTRRRAHRLSSGPSCPTHISFLLTEYWSTCRRGGEDDNRNGTAGMNNSNNNKTVFVVRDLSQILVTTKRNCGRVLLGFVMWMADGVIMMMPPLNSCPHFPTITGQPGMEHHSRKPQGHLWKCGSGRKGGSSNAYGYGTIKRLGVSISLQKHHVLELFKFHHRLIVSHTYVHTYVPDWLPLKIEMVLSGRWKL